MGSLLKCVCIFTAILLIHSAPVKAKFKFSDDYTVSNYGVGTDGSKIIEVTAYGDNVQKAMQQAKINAIAALIFKGVPAGYGSSSIPALCENGEQTYTANSKYFNNFFNKSKTYLQFVNLVTSDEPSGANNIRTKKGQLIKINVQVLYDQLRKRLENDGIIGSLQSVSTSSGKKPIIMVVPETAWMKQKGYLVNGVPSFRRALETNNDLRNCITELNNLMVEKGYPLASLEAKLDELDNEAARSELATAKDGGYMKTSDLDELSRVANADIFITLSIEPKTVGPRHSYEFRINSCDASSLKNIHGTVATSSISSAPASSLIREGMLNIIDGFTSKLQRHFEETAINGREGTLILKISENTPLEFDSDVTIGNETGELQDAIDAWLEKNTVNGQFSKTRNSPTTLVYEQVRMPLRGKNTFSKKESAIDAEKFSKQLGTYLRQFGLSTRVDMLALGKAYIYIGTL